MSADLRNFRILLADDHKLFRDGLRSMLETHADFVVVGEARDGQSAVKFAAELKPDVILMDITMPDLNGIEAAKRILADTPGVRVIILSMHADRRYIIEALKAGACGYLLKDSALEEVAGAIRSTQPGKISLSSTISQFVLNDYIQSAPTDESTAYTILSAREREVLQMLAEGKTTKEIAGQLDVSVKTIETYRKQIMDKLDLHSIAELTKYAIREGLTQLN